MRGDDTGGCWQVFRKWCEGGDGTVLGSGRYLGKWFERCYLRFSDI